MEIYVDLQGVETPIVIYLYTAQRWLNKLNYKYKDVRKDVFVDKYKQSNIVKDCKNFPKKMKKLKSYMVEFKEDETIKPKIYLPDCIVRKDNCYLIIMITLW